MLPGSAGIYSPARLSPARVSPPADPSVYSIHRAWWDPEQGSQGHVPAAQALVRAPAPGWPRNSFASDVSPDPVLAANFTGLLPPQDPLEEPSFPVMTEYQEGGDPADDSDSDLRRLLDL